MIIAALASLINTIKSQFRLLQFDLDEERFSLAIEKPVNSTKLTIEVRGDRDTSEESLKSYIRSARIVSESFLDDIGNKRMLGAQRKILAKPIFESRSERARIVVLLDGNDPLIRFGEELKSQVQAKKLTMISLHQSGFFRHNIGG